jgi:hypothetical protein
LCGSLVAAGWVRSAEADQRAQEVDETLASLLDLVEECLLLWCEVRPGDLLVE